MGCCLGCRWSNSRADVGRQERLGSHRERTWQVYALQQHRQILPLHPAVEPLGEGGLVHLHQLQGGALHDGPIAQNELPDLAVVLQDQSPPGHVARALLPGTLVYVREPDEDGLHKAAAVWPLGRRTSGPHDTPLHTLHTWRELHLLFCAEPPLNQPVKVPRSKHDPLLVVIQQVLPQPHNVADLRRKENIYYICLFIYYKYRKQIAVVQCMSC